MRAAHGIVIAAAIAMAGCAKVVVVKVDGHKQPAEGVFYALPRTVIRVDVKIDRKEPKVADVPFMTFADIFAPGGKTACTDRDCADDGVKYELRDGVTLSTYGEPDANHVYMVKFANGRAVDQTLNLTWTEQGLASTVSASVTNRSSDIAMSALKVAAGIGTRAAAGAAKTGVTETPPACLESSTNDAWVTEVLRTTVPTSNYSTMLVENYCGLPKDRRDKLTDTKANRDKLAAARRAYAVRVEPLLAAMDRQLLGTSNTANPMAVIDRLEGLLADQLNALFLGTTETKTWEGALDIRSYPEGQSVPLLCVDPARGVRVIAERAPEAKPFPDGFSELEEAGCKTANVALTVGFHPKEADQLFRKVADGTSELAGDLSFRYRIPARVRGVVTFKPQAAEKAGEKAGEKVAEKVYGAAVFSVAQEKWGHVVALPAKRHAKMLSYDLAFIEATGGLKSFKLGSTGGLDASTVDAFGGAANSVLDARNTRREKDQAVRDKEEAAAAAEVDELNVLTRRANILKLRDQICELQKKYGLSCDTP